MPGVDIRCVTHHFACECREAIFAELLEAAKTFMSYGPYLGTIFKKAPDEYNKLVQAIAKAERAGVGE